MKNFKVLSFGLMFLFLAGCSSNNVSLDNDSKVYLTKDIAINLPYNSILEPGEIQEALSIEYNNASYNLLVILNNQEDKLSLVAMSDLGIKLFAAEYNNKSIEVRKFINIEKLPESKQVLLDIFLSHANKDAISELLKSKVNLIENNHERKINTLDNEPIYTIKYDVIDFKRLPIELKHHLFKYKIKITYI